MAVIIKIKDLVRIHVYVVAVYSLYTLVNMSSYPSDVAELGELRK